MARIALKELDSERSLAVEQLEALIGRDPACGFVIEGPKSKVVSGRHARIFCQDGTWWIQDMSRNGTILDDERLQSGQRHALRPGQVIGLGESGPRLRVMTLETRNISDTMLEPASIAASPQTTAPRPRPMGVPTGAIANEGTAAMRKSEAMRAGIKFEEPTEPAKLGGAWHLIVTLRATHSDQRFDAKAAVVKIGRSPECGIRIPPEQGASVSRVHAEIAVGDTGVVVRDAGSRNGTFLNGVRIQASHALVTGDKLTLGTGGPTLAVEEMHIVKGEGPQPVAVPKIGGSTTPDAFAARGGSNAPSREPSTAPSAADASDRIPASGMGAQPSMRSPAHGVVPQTSMSGSLAAPARGRIAIIVIIGVLILALAVAFGRLTAS
jgi:pSer/pThr/pTyr-binding forkhead associated (FHA) protein